MKIVHYYRWALGGHSGANEVVRSWCSAQAAAGHEVSLAIHPAHRRVQAPAGTRVVAVPHHGRKRWSIPRSDSWLDGQHLAVIHAGWRPANVMAARMSRRRGTPYLVAAHGVYIDPIVERNRGIKRAWFELAERGFLDNASGIHVYFEEELAGLRRLGIDRPAVVAPCGFDPPTALRWERAERPYLLWLGRYDVKQKGLDLLVDAIGSLEPATRPRLRMHGFEYRDGRHRLERLIARRHLERWIEVGPPVRGAAKWEVLRRAAAFVYPSRFEAFGLAVMEAASVGVPTLVTPFPLGRLLSESGAALLAQPRPATLAEGIEMVLGDEGARVAERAPRVIESRFDWNRIVGLWAGQITELLPPIGTP